ncbi:MAG: hypothetical protein AAF563_19985, partial [Pseudomonadota bacterium]
MVESFRDSAKVGESALLLDRERMPVWWVLQQANTQKKTTPATHKRKRESGKNREHAEETAGGRG